MLWPATFKVETWRVQLPPVPAVPVPRLVSPSKKVTVPVGVVPVTTAVRVTAVP